MVDKPDPSAIVIPFGKHKGATVAELLATDPQYADWLVAQGWLAQRFAELHAAIITRGAGADDSPEHNVIQARFLDPLFRAAFVLTVTSEARLEKGRDLAREYEVHTRKYSLEILDNQLWRAKQSRAAEETAKITAQIEAANARNAAPITLVFTSRAGFEDRGIDVRLRWWFQQAGVSRSQADETTGRNHAIEIKPSMGDDYPTVLRQMQRLEADYLVVDSYNGAVPFEAVRQMFGGRMITVRQIEAEIANARALISHD